MSTLHLRSFPSLVNVGWWVWWSFTYTSPGQKSNPCSDSPLKCTTSPFFMPFSSSNFRSLGAMMIFSPLQAGHLPPPPWLCPVPLQCLQISPRLKEYTQSPPVQNLSRGTYIQVLKSPPFLNGFFQSSFKPSSPCRSQVIRLATSMSVSYANFMSTYFYWASGLPALRSGWYLTESFLKAFLSQSEVAFQVTPSSSQRRVSRWHSPSHRQSKIMRASQQPRMYTSIITTIQSR